MSELIVKYDRKQELQRRLLITVSALALAVPTAGVAEVDDAGSQPSVWIELGAQLERIEGGQQAFTPPFMDSPPSFATPTPFVQRSGRYSNGVEGKISFEPSHTDWVLSAGVRYGRSQSKRQVHEQTVPVSHYIPGSIFTGTSGGTFYLPPGTNGPGIPHFADQNSKQWESHAVVDFQAGKDVGLGMFGRKGDSILSFGVRMAQFTTKSDVTTYADFNYYRAPRHLAPKYYQNYATHADVERSFRGVGPSIAWTGSAPIAGNDETVGIALDWGANAAILFGRQKVSSSHHTSSHYTAKLSLPPTLGGYHRSGGYAHATTIRRSHSAIVPNVGGSLGVSFQHANAKVSFGYRADFFFGAMDGGVDIRQTYDRSFHGPFATVSIGLGG